MARNYCPNCSTFEFKDIHGDFKKKVIGHFDTALNKTIYYEDNTKYATERKCRHCLKQIGFYDLAS